jgi:tocopherol O-methyltransferase
MTNKDSIATWYDETIPFYKYFWYLNSDSFALHYGLWNKDTKSFAEALQNINKFMAEQAEITSDSKVLDAGCGIGGSALWLAKHSGAHVVGISISEKQIEKANSLAKAKKLDQLVTFSVNDYLRTGYPDESFDVVWAIESVCHANRKEDFLKEAYRLLKKGGRLIIADGFKKREPKSTKEEQILSDFYKGMLLPNLYTFKQFENAMGLSGFKNIKVIDKTQEILPSAKRFNRICHFLYPFIFIAANIHLIPKILIAGCKAGIVQYNGVQSGLGGYAVMYGEK